jgi:hypothetical protein
MPIIQSFTVIYIYIYIYTFHCLNTIIMHTHVEIISSVQLSLHWLTLAVAGPDPHQLYAVHTNLTPSINPFTDLV